MVTDFQNKCYFLLKKVPKGKVITYKNLAKALNTKAYRAVGSSMKKNPFSPKIPCHRVINSNGSVGNYALGKEKKIKMLTEEGIEIFNGKIDLNKYGFKF